MQIIDSHIHLWDLGLKKHSWLLEKPGEGFLGDYTALQTSYLPKDYLHDAKDYEISKTVHIQAGWSREDFLGETQWLTALNNAQGSPNAIVAYLNLLSPQLDEELEALSHYSLVKGIRQITAWHKDPYYCSCPMDYLADKTWQKQFAKLAAKNLSFDLQIFPEQAEIAYELAKANPQINIVIEHALQPIQHNAEYLNFWRKQLQKLAQLPNCYLKLSGLRLFNHQADKNTLKTVIGICIDIFSPKRCMFGSNFPVEKLFTSYTELVSFYLTTTKQYSSAEQQQLFYATAAKFYDLSSSL